MGVAAEVLAQQLDHYGHGRALWTPEPSDDNGKAYEVRIGDVGHIDEDGAFHRLFNVTVDADHELNRGGVPEGFKPLRFNPRLLSIRPDQFPPSPFCSRSVKSHKAEGHAQASGNSVVGASLAYNFECSSAQGGLLILRDSATKTLVMPCTSITQYIKQNHDSWYAFAINQDTYGLDCKPEDIILVRGTIKTSAWAVAAFIESGNHVHDVSFSGQVGPFADAGFNWASQQSRQSSFEYRTGPSRIKRTHSPRPSISSETAVAPSVKSGKLELPELEVAATMSSDVVPGDTKDQTVFLGYYKVKRRMWLGKKVVAAAGAEELPPDTSGQGPSASAVLSPTRELSVEMHPSHDRLRTAIDDVLDYILKHSEADTAVVSDGEISDLFGGESLPEDIKAWLRENMPTIDVDDEGTGTISPLESIRRAHMATQTQQEIRATAAWEARHVEAIQAQEIADAEAREREMQGDREREEPAEFQQGSSGQQAEGSYEPQAAAEFATAGQPAEVPPTEGPADDVAAEEEPADVTPPPPDSHGDTADTSRPPITMPEIPEERLSGSVVIAEGRAIIGKAGGSTRTSHFPHIVLSDKSAEGGAIASVSITKDGMYVATGCEDAYVRIYDLELGSLTSKLEQHEDTVWVVKFAPDGTRLVSGSADHKAILWNVHTHEVIREMPGHEGDVWVLDYSPDSKFIATGSVDTTVRLWDGRTGHALATLEGHSAVIMCVVFAPDSRSLATCADNIAHLWDVASGQLVARLAGHTSVIWSLAFAPDGARVVTSAEDHSSRIWDTETGDELVILNEHTGPVWSGTFSPDGTVVASGSYDASVIVCDSFSGERLHLLEKAPASIVNIVAYSKDSDFLAAGQADGHVRVWNARTGEFVVEFQGHEDKVKTVEFTPDDNSIMTSSDDGSVRIWSMVDALRL